MVIDTNIALHQMDLLEDAAVRDVVVPVVVRDEVKHRNTAAYNRLQVRECHEPSPRTTPVAQGLSGGGVVC